MKRFLLLIGLWGLTACAGLPQLHPVGDLGDVSDAHLTSCNTPFPVGNWQFLHTVEAQFSGGKKSILMGVTDIFSQSKRVRMVIMTVEGLVLFQAEHDRELVVQRGVAPFDSKAFAQGLMDDIRLIFYRPSDPMTVTGHQQNGALICRHEAQDGRIIDTVINTTGSWEIRRYNPRHRLSRRVQSLPIEQVANSLPPALELTAHGKRAYRLKLTLVKATRIP